MSVPVSSADDTECILCLTANLIWFVISKRVLTEFILCVIGALSSDWNSAVSVSNVSRISKGLASHSNQNSANLFNSQEGYDIGYSSKTKTL